VNNIMQTIFEAKNNQKVAITFDELLHEQGRVLPNREELSVINYNIGYPYAGYDHGYYQTSHNVPNHMIDNHQNGNEQYHVRFDCYANVEPKEHPVKYDENYWKHMEGANDKNYTYSSNYNDSYYGSNYYASGYPYGGYYSGYPYNDYAGNYSYNGSYPYSGYYSSPYIYNA
jgi:hypothetical protein